MSLLCPPFTLSPWFCFHRLLCYVQSTVHIQPNQGLQSPKHQQFLNFWYKLGLWQQNWLGTVLHCVCFAGRVCGLRSDKAVENPRLERKRGEQAWHWASALEHHADQDSQRDGRSPLKGLCWAWCFSPFHAWKQNAGSNSFCWFLWCVCLAVTDESFISLSMGQSSCI